MTKFLLFVLLNFVTCISVILGMVYAAKYFFKRPLQNRTTKKEIILISLLISLVLTSVTFIDLSHQRFVSPSVGAIVLVLETVMFLLWLKRHIQYNSYRIPLLLLVFSGCINNIVDMVLRFFWYTYEDWFNTLPPITDVLVDLIWPWPALLIIILICKTVPLANGYQRLLDFPKLTYGIITLYYSIEVTVFILNLDTVRTPGLEYLSLYISSGFILLFMAIMMLLREIDHKYSLSYSKQLIYEQQIYVNHVETLSRDLQKLQHDYKNLLSGMYLQVSEGKIDEVKKYLSSNLMSGDEVLLRNLKSQKQLGNIKLVEVKSLVLTKIMKAKELDVTFNLEVINAITKVSISLNDFLRVLGIALDNAIEAASEAGQTASIDVLFIQENDEVEIVIKNPFSGIIDSDKIWQNGYSTKGANRGLGLSNYREILDSYDQVLRETRITDTHFTQTITIPI